MLEAITRALIPAGAVQLNGDLNIPASARGLVVFVHGSGSSRLSPRNVFVADELQKSGFATLLFDLLTPEEDRDYQTRFDIDLLTSRLVMAIQWIDEQHNLAPLPTGLFGASTGAAAALRGAAELGGRIAAVVSRGGRPDLAAADLHIVATPCLFIVGGHDPEVLNLNRQAMRALPESTVKHLEIVQGATHLFEEPGTLEQVAKLAGDWFVRYAARPDARWEGC
ncbi:MAG: dienelactone hydrolase family protein [Fimbriimonadales bacterium]